MKFNLTDDDMDGAAHPCAFTSNKRPTSSKNDICYIWDRQQNVPFYQRTTNNRMKKKNWYSNGHEWPQNKYYCFSLFLLG